MPVKHRWLLAEKRCDDFGMGKMRVEMSSRNRWQHLLMQKLVWQSHVHESGEDWLMFTINCCSALHVGNGAEFSCLMINFDAQTGTKRYHITHLDPKAKGLPQVPLQ